MALTLGCAHQCVRQPAGNLLRVEAGEPACGGGPYGRRKGSDQLGALSGAASTQGIVLGRPSGVGVERNPGCAVWSAASAVATSSLRAAERLLLRVETGESACGGGCPAVLYEPGGGRLAGGRRAASWASVRILVARMSDNEAVHRLEALGSAPDFGQFYVDTHILLHPSHEHSPNILH